LNLLYKMKRGLWIGLREVAREWHRRGAQLPADVIVPFKTQNNTLSVYALDEARANVARVLAAIASGSQDGLIDTDCLIFDSAIVDGLGIKRQKTPGATPDGGANDWHWDLAELTGTQIVSLADALVEGAEVEMVLAPDLIRALREATATDQVKLQDLKPKVRKQLEL
jgi:hypothetical protein